MADSKKLKRRITLELTDSQIYALQSILAGRIDTMPSYSRLLDYVWSDVFAIKHQLDTIIIKGFGDAKSSQEENLKKVG